MEEQPGRSSGPGGGDQRGGEQPKFFSTVNGMIAGATGLVIALGGLATAYKQIFDDDKAEAAAPVPASAETAKPTAAPVAAAETVADQPLLFEGTDEKGRPVKLEFTDDQWVLTEERGTYYYEDLYSPDRSRLLAVDAKNDSYLRWPVEGGMAEESTDEKKNWSSYVKLYPPGPEAEREVLAE